MNDRRIENASAFFSALQDSICEGLAVADGGTQFTEDRWSHEDQGGGRTRVLEDGAVFEKGAVNFSNVASRLSEEAAGRMNVAAQRIFATGISLIMHPRNPFVPTVHANFRYLELENGTWWFGGGSDLTPHYLFDDDARHFHAVWKRACDNHDPQYYSTFKAWCDRYFFIPHRNESRGIGGILFDNLSGEFEQLFAFVQECGSSFLDAYRPIVSRRSPMPYEERQRRWQLQRRGRYAEFNLVYDRGTRFGLDTGGRIESILVSLPPLARWDYMTEPEPDSEEDKLLQVLRTPRSWM